MSEAEDDGDWCTHCGKSEDDCECYVSCGCAGSFAWDGLDDHGFCPRCANDSTNWDSSESDSEYQSDIIDKHLARHLEGGEG